MRSKGLSAMCTLYQSSDAATSFFHHSDAVRERSAMMGSAKRSQSPKMRGPCCASHGARGGRSGDPVLMVSTPLTTPWSSRGSCILFCISFIESIMIAMNSRDLSVKLALGSESLDFFRWGSAGSLVVSASLDWELLGSSAGFCWWGSAASLNWELLGSSVDLRLWWSAASLVVSASLCWELLGSSAGLLRWGSAASLVVSASLWSPVGVEN